MARVEIARLSEYVWFTRLSALVTLVPMREVIRDALKMASEGASEEEIKPKARVVLVTMRRP